MEQRNISRRQHRLALGALAALLALASVYLGATWVGPTLENGPEPTYWRAMACFAARASVWALYTFISLDVCDRLNTWLWRFR